jgi:multidrug efflux pump subunit AcrA (membrane-fusion protein)
MIGFVRKMFKKFTSLSLKKKILLVIVFAVSLFLIFFWISKGSENQYVMETVKRSTVTQSVSEIGNIKSGASINVKSTTTGKVEEVLIKNRDKTAEGDVLVKIESSATEQEQSAAYSDYLTAVSTLNTAKSNLDAFRSDMFQQWDTYRALATNDTYEESDGVPDEDNRTAPEFHIAKDDWLSAEAKYKDQSNVVSQAQAKANSTRILYEATQDSEIKATADGIIANLAVTQGSGVESGDSVLFIVSESDPIIHVAINEVDIGKVKVNQKAEVDVDAIDDKVFKGIVERIDTVGTNTQGVITYNVFVRLTEKDPLIRTEMTANVKILTNSKRDALSVSNSAIKPYQGGRAVRILKDNKPEHLPVRLGIRGDVRSEILEGLMDGQEIIIGAKNDLIKSTGGFGF